MTEEILLDVQNLKVHFPITEGVIFKKQMGAIRAVDGIDFQLIQGETLGLVGESGCGKSTVAKAIAKLSNTTNGNILYQNYDLAKLSQKEFLKHRKDIQMIFQDPYASLNPRMTVANTIAEPMEIYSNLGLLDMGKRQIEKRVEMLMERVGLTRFYKNRYPHEFSGGQRQRVGIARAIALNPKIILADEPVSALDVSIQSQILNLLKDIQDEFGLTYLFIAHDLSVIEYISNRVAVMYLGKIVEIADADSLYNKPLHPYTEALLSAAPVPDPRIEKTRKRIILTGDVPSPDKKRTGCYFQERCPKAMVLCKNRIPALTQIEEGHQVSCFLYSNEV